MAKKPLAVGDKFIEVVVGEDGATSVEAHGFAGKGCREATKGIEDALGVAANRRDKRGPDVKQTVRAG